MPNLLEQHHNRPRLVAVVGGRRRPAPAVSAPRNRAVSAATRANRTLSVIPGGRSRRPDHPVVRLVTEASDPTPPAPAVEPSAPAA